MEGMPSAATMVPRTFVFRRNSQRLEFHSRFSGLQAKPSLRRECLSQFANPDLEHEIQKWNLPRKHCAFHCTFVV